LHWPGGGDPRAPVNDQENSGLGAGLNYIGGNKREAQATASRFYLRMLSSENRFTLFRIML
jgi:hypothetical protein